MAIAIVMVIAMIYQFYNGVIDKNIRADILQPGVVVSDGEGTK